MKMPIKLNKTGWPTFVTRWLPATNDPRVLLQPNLDPEAFTLAVCVFKFGSTFKITKRARFPKTVKILANLDFPTPPVILDVGASDGITSLYVMQNLAFKKYFVTDLNPEVHYVSQDGRDYFYAPNGNCILIVSDRLVVYSDYEDSNPLLRKLAERLFLKKPNFDDNLQQIELINPAVKNSFDDVVVCRHSIFDPWQREKPNLVIAANILNRVYFSDSLLSQAVDNLLTSLADDGVLAVIDSREGKVIENSTVFKKSAGRLAVVGCINGGTEIQDLILDHSNESN